MFVKKEHCESITFFDGSVVVVREIIDRTSFDLYQSAIHYSICHELARTRSTNETTRMVLENIFSLKSPVARKATAIVEYAESSTIQVSSIRVGKSVFEALPLDWKRRFKVEVIESLKEPLVDWRNVVLLILKAVMHRIFRLAPVCVQPATPIVRSWVEVSEKMYPMEVRRGHVLVYPFALKFARQLKFLRWCRKERVRFSLMGAPYNIPRILRSIFRREPNDLIMAKAEISANNLHGLELIRLKPQIVLTSDEYETGSFVMHRQLLAAGVNVINTAHGVGNYCPNVAYREFRFISEAQANFYKERNSSICFVPIVPEVRRSNGLSHYSSKITAPPALVLVHQPFDTSMLNAEAEALKRLDGMLSVLSKKLGVPYFIKMHPNFRRMSPFTSGYRYFGEAASNWSVLDVFRPIFVTINSTVFFDVRGAAPIIVFRGKTFNPSIYFPGSFISFNFDDAEAIICGLLDSSSWIKAASIHAEQI